CRVGCCKRFEFDKRGRVIDRLGCRRDGVRVAANGVTLSNAARIEAHRVMLARKLVDMLQPAELAKYFADAHAWSARNEQNYAFLSSRVARRDAAEAKRELRTVGTPLIDRHFQAGALRVRHVAAGPPMEFPRRALLRPRGRRAQGERQLGAKEDQKEDEFSIRHEVSFLLLSASGAPRLRRDHLVRLRGSPRTLHR